MGNSCGKEVALPWKEKSLVKVRQEFVDACIEKQAGMTELCRRFGISRKTGYKWRDRYLSTCEVMDRSRRPKTSPSAVAPSLEKAIVAARKEHPRWGPRKLRAALQRANPGVPLPSSSTFANVLKRNGLIVPRRRRRGIQPSTSPLGHAAGPNDLWCIDFKGDFATGNSRCYPLTITDAYSRYLIACVALPNTRAATVRPVMRRVFEEFGLPAAIRSDNGPPFASLAPLGLSELSVWWLRLGIKHERIEPGKPQQNGRHERMHLTLKQETVTPPKNSRVAQQRAFDSFRAEFNDTRPHEALDNRVPADFYERSRRLYRAVDDFRDYAYDPEVFGETARVGDDGAVFDFDGGRVFISETLKHQLLGLEWVDTHWNVFFQALRIGSIRRTAGKTRFVREPAGGYGRPSHAASGARASHGR
jgi:transposase InsO family protein